LQTHGSGAWFETRGFAALLTMRSFQSASS
jgi:hypothetical protein